MIHANVQQARAQSKPDPYLILSVGKKTEQTAVQMRTDSPVWEQGFTFLVANPDNDTLQLRIVDQKTEKEIGRYTYILSALLMADNMAVTAQPFRLQKSGPDSILTMSLVMRIFKKAAQDDTQSSPGSGLSRTSSMRSNSEITTTASGGGAVPTLQKQDSKISVHSQFVQGDGDSVGGNSGAIVEEDFVESTVVAGQQLSASPSFLHKNIDAGSSPAHLIHRTPSVTSSAGSAGLGRIQLTLRYSIHRQRLIVIVHKIM